MRTSVAVALGLIWPLLSMAQTGRVSGKVTDGADHGAIWGAEVVLELDGKQVRGPIYTEKDGTYKVEGLTTGKTYRVTYSDNDEGYAPFVYPVTVTSVFNAQLRKHQASKSYWILTAVTMEKDINALPVGKRAEQSARAWAALSNSGVSAEGLATVANQLKSKPEFSDLKDESFRLYSEADPEQLKAVEDAYRSNRTIPVMENFNTKLSKDIETRERTFHSPRIPLR
jgi:hypothetical protein